MERDVGIYRRPNAVATEVGATYKPKDFANTLECLKRAFSEGADKKKPPKLSEHEWLRRINMVDIYCYETDSLQKDVGRDHGITRERARQLIKKTILDLWHNASLQTQELFPIEALCFRKPFSQKLRERMSLAQRGISVLIMEGLRAGKSIQQIQEENAIPLSQIFSSRHTLRTWGFELPYRRTTPSQNIELENQLRETKTDEEKKELLRQVKHAFYANHVAGENPILTSITNAIREAGFYIESRRGTVLFLTPLRDSGFPIEQLRQRINMPTQKTRSYHFFLSQDKERAKNIWLQDKNLQRFLI